MDAACTGPKQKKQAGDNRHIQAEIVEEILLNLPVKSLLRFSSVSKPWNSMIFGLRFAKRYCGRAAIPGRERIVIDPSSCCHLDNAFSYPVSSLSSDQPIGDATKIICPIQWWPEIRAFCNGLWCVEVDKSLFLWNPSMKTYKKLADPPPLVDNFGLVYGLGYDSIGDDYKILRTPWLGSDRAELYSLRSNSWKMIQPLPAKFLLPSRGVFLGGAIHWMVHDLSKPRHGPLNPRDIISFDLSTEKYGVVAQPPYSPTPNPLELDVVEATVLRGMLCVGLNYSKKNIFVLWVMEVYGVGNSWTKKFDINYCNVIPYFPGKIRAQTLIELRPLYFYDNGEILVKVDPGQSNLGLFMFKDEKTIPRKIFDCNGYLYVESLISPATSPMIVAPGVGNQG